MEQIQLPKLNILLGAGSTVGAGMPTTSEITNCLENLVAHNVAYFTFLKALLVKKGHYEQVNFELMLHALEQLQPLEIEPQNSTHDYYRPVLKTFMEFGDHTKALLGTGALSYWRGNAIRTLLSFINERIDKSEIKEKHLSDLLLRLNEQFSLKVFTLNYDDLVDRVKLPWCDGFEASSDFSNTFNAKKFIEEGQGQTPLLVHLHGSTRFGYEQGGAYVDIHKYASPKTAINHAVDNGFCRNINGRLVISGPIISGLNKADQLLFRPCPYGYYFKSFMDNLLSNERLLIIGYGGWDTHINEWILQSLQLHGDAAKIVYMTKLGAESSTNQALIDRIKLLTNAAKGTSSCENKNLLLEVTTFPFADHLTMERIEKFLTAGSPAHVMAK